MAGIGKTFYRRSIAWVVWVILWALCAPVIFIAGVVCLILMGLIYGVGLFFWLFHWSTQVRVGRPVTPFVRWFHDRLRD
jgi:hypothetical protein